MKIRRLILIVGTHRSGTSTLAGCLHTARIPFGGPLLAATPENPKGYFEHQAVVYAHDLILSRHESSWVDLARAGVSWGYRDEAQIVESIQEVISGITGAETSFAIKDPRMTLFLPQWEAAATAVGWEPYWILVVRDPVGTIASLVKRDRLAPEHAQGIWQRDLHAAARFLPGRPHQVISYEALLAKPGPTLEPLIAAGVLAAENLAAAAAFVDQSLDHSGDARRTHLRFAGNDALALRDHLEIAARAGQCLGPPPTMRPFDPALLVHSGPQPPIQVPVQVFFANRPDEFTESSSITRRIAAYATQKASFRLPGDRGWELLRIDPSTRLGVVILTQAIILTASGPRPLEEVADLHLDSQGHLRKTPVSWLIMSREADCRLIIRFRIPLAVLGIDLTLAIVPTDGRTHLHIDERGLFLPGGVEIATPLVSAARAIAAEAKAADLMAEKLALSERLAEAGRELERSQTLRLAEQQALRQQLALLEEGARREGAAREGLRTAEAQALRDQAARLHAEIRREQDINQTLQGHLSKSGHEHAAVLKLLDEAEARRDGLMQELSRERGHRDELSAALATMTSQLAYSNGSLEELRKATVGALAQQNRLDSHLSGIARIFTDQDDQNQRLAKANADLESELGRANQITGQLRSLLRHIQQSRKWQISSQLDQMVPRWLKPGLTAIHRLIFLRAFNMVAMLRRQKLMRVMRDSGMFDETWYLVTYPDVRETGADPILHYLCFGAQEGRNPSAGFDSLWYQREYPDVAVSAMNPLFHYIVFGAKEGRRPLPTPRA